MPSSAIADAPVLIVGAGPTGLATALALAQCQVATIIIERHAELNDHPKARGVRLRTMEILRGWGIEEELVACALPAEAQRFIYCDSVAGTELGRTAEVGDVETQVSPSRSLRVAQDAVEAALMRRALAHPLIDVRMGTEVISLAEDASGVMVSCEHSTPDGSRSALLRACFVLAADGAGSKVRRLLEVEMDGLALLGYWQSIYWRGDIANVVAGRHCIQFHTGARQGKSLSVASVDGLDRWITMVASNAAAERPNPMSADEARTAIRTAVGDPMLEPEVLDVGIWRISALVARTWQKGRVLLLGDAAHTFPPTGGFGMNCGIQDAYNLAWKLALVLQDQATSQLIATYEQERKPLAAEYATWSVSNGARNREINEAIVAGDSPRLAELLDAQRDHVLALHQDLGFTYRSFAVQQGSDNDVAHAAEDFSQAVRLGQRAPHAWLKRAHSRTSSLDLINYGFTLLVANTHRDWLPATFKLPPHLPAVTGYVIGPGLAIEPADAEFDRLYELDLRGPILIRPDGHVAWRFGPGVPDPSEALVRALTELTRPSDVDG